MKTKISIIAGIFVVAVVLLVSTSNASAKSSTTKPGWGYGDKNHVHVGPPGQSVRP